MQETQLCRTQIESALLRVEEKRRMERELAEIFARDPDPLSLAPYDNLHPVMMELHHILDSARRSARSSIFPFKAQHSPPLAVPSYAAERRDMSAVQGLIDGTAPHFGRYSGLQPVLWVGGRRGVHRPPQHLAQLYQRQRTSFTWR